MPSVRGSDRGKSSVEQCAQILSQQKPVGGVVMRSIAPAPFASRTARLLKRLQRMELAPADQRAVLKFIKAMLDTNRPSMPPARTKGRAS